MPTFGENLSRRAVVAGLAGSAAVMSSGPVWALSSDQARAHVEKTVEDVRKILGGGSVKPSDLRSVMSRRSNLPLIAQFCAGRAWREMNGGQRSQYIEAFSHYISVTYARRFSDFAGTPDISVGRITDAGRKGMLVETPIVMPTGKRFLVEWMVSDRGGKVEIVDLVVERVSLAATQRDEIGAMLDKRGGDVDALIKALNETG